MREFTAIIVGGVLFGSLFGQGIKAQQCISVQTFDAPGGAYYVIKSHNLKDGTSKSIQQGNVKNEEEAHQEVKNTIAKLHFGDLPRCDTEVSREIIKKMQAEKEKGKKENKGKQSSPRPSPQL